MTCSEVLSGRVIPRRPGTANPRGSNQNPSSAGTASVPLHRPTRRPKPACSTAPGGPQENQGSGAVTPRNSSIPRPGIALPCQDATTAPAGLDELCRAAHILSELGVPVGPHALAGPVWPIILPRRSADPPCPLADADTKRLVDREFAMRCLHWDSAGSVPTEALPFDLGSRMREAPDCKSGRPGRAGTVDTRKHKSRTQSDWPGCRPSFFAV